MLPFEIIVNILRYLDNKSLIKLRKVKLFTSKIDYLVDSRLHYKEITNYDIETIKKYYQNSNKISFVSANSRDFHHIMTNKHLVFNLSYIGEFLSQGLIYIEDINLIKCSNAYYVYEYVNDDNKEKFILVKFDSFGEFLDEYGDYSKL